jgi:hypothetical protein
MTLWNVEQRLDRDRHIGREVEMRLRRVVRRTDLLEESGMLLLCDTVLALQPQRSKRLDYGSVDREREAHEIGVLLCDALKLILKKS